MSLDDFNDEKAAEGLASDLNPLREAIFEAAEDSAKADPLASLDMAAVASLPVAESSPVGMPTPGPEVAVKAKVAKPSLAERLSRMSPYNVMLAVALVSLLSAMLFMVLELSSYDWTISAK